MAKLAQALRALFRGKNTTQLYNQLEDILLEGDIGPAMAMQLRDLLEAKNVTTEEAAIALLRDELGRYIHVADLPVDEKNLNLFLFLGVNGVGKTTSLAKLAYYLKNQKHINKIVCACGDTFRAAASEQLAIHGERVGFRVVRSSQGADPGAVIHDAITSAISQNDQVILADTAGRMHNRTELVNELKKIDKIIRARIAENAYHRILVIDATTGQNGLRQAELFHEAVQLSGVIVTKYDSGSKAGSLASIGKNLNLPIYFVGTGETMQDFSPFSPQQYLDTLLG